MVGWGKMLEARMDDEMEEVVLANGERVWLEWTDNDEMVAWTDEQPRRRIGAFSFAAKEGPGGEPYFKLTHAHLEGPDGPDQGRYAHRGVGREILKSMSQPVVVGRDDGQRRDDGSHLTGDGPGFVAKMVKEGLLSWDSVGD
jgi:hypothetical protein